MTEPIVLHPVPVSSVVEYLQERCDHHRAWREVHPPEVPSGE